MTLAKLHAAPNVAIRKIGVILQLASDGKRKPTALPWVCQLDRYKRQNPKTHGIAVGFPRMESPLHP